MNLREFLGPLIGISPERLTPEVQGIWLRKIGGRLRIVIDAGGHMIGVLSDEGRIVYVPAQRYLHEISNGAERSMRAKRGRWYDPTPEEVESIWHNGRFYRCCLDRREIVAYERIIRGDRETEGRSVDREDDCAPAQSARHDQPPAR